MLLQLEKIQMESGQPRNESINFYANSEGLTLKPETIAMKLKSIKNDQQSVQTLPSLNNPLPSSSLRVFVGHLRSRSNEETLRAYFKQFGVVSDVYFPRDPSGGHRGYAFVTFGTINKNPLEVTNHVIDGTPAYLDHSNN